MYAIIETGGKQAVVPGETVKVEKLEVEKEPRHQRL